MAEAIMMLPCAIHISRKTGKVTHYDIAPATLDDLIRFDRTIHGLRWPGEPLREGLIDFQYADNEKEATPCFTD